MSSTIRCDIVSAEEEIFHGVVQMVVATGEMGELGIAPRHAPLITRLKPGQVRVILEGGEEQFFYVSGGILEVQPQVVTVLADTAIRAKDLDEAAAQAGQGRSREGHPQSHRRDGSGRSPGPSGRGRGAVAGAGALAQEPQALRHRP
jgi:ATP synthase F1 epsilon subunit